MLLPAVLLLAVTASMDLFARATDPNPTLNSYTASVQLTAALRAATPVRKTFSGTAYYQRPNRRIELQGVNGPLSRFADLARTTPSYEEAMQQYAITPIGDDGAVSTYRLVPRKPSERFKNLVVTISDRTALLHSATWTYPAGGTLSLKQTYALAGNFRLPVKATISARFPGYNVDGTLRFFDYQFR